MNTGLQPPSSPKTRRTAFNRAVFESDFARIAGMAVGGLRERDPDAHELRGVERHWSRGAEDIGFGAVQIRRAADEHRVCGPITGGATKVIPQSVIAAVWTLRRSHHRTTGYRRR